MGPVTVLPVWYLGEKTMHMWSTVFQPVFGTPLGARRALEALVLYANLACIPRTATWSAYRRGVDIVVCAEW